MGESSSSRTRETSTFESPSWDPLVAHSASTGWTDDKHSLFLDSIESSFVDQLYSNQNHLNDFYGLLLGSKKRSYSCRPHDNEFEPDKFKVMRRGCWENVRFESDKTQVKSNNYCRRMLSSQWIQRFRSPSTGKEVCKNAFGMLTENKFVNISIHAASQKHCRKETNQKKLSYSRGICGEDLIDSKIEISDQNFVDDESEVVQQSSRICNGISCKNTQSNGSITDKVVVSGEDTLLEEPNAEPSGKTSVPLGSNSEVLVFRDQG